MNHRRKLVGAIGALAFPAPFGALGQSATAAPRVVLLISSSMRTQSERVDAFRKRLRELGYIEGKNLIFELRELDGKVDQLPAIMREIVQSNPAVIVTHGAGNQAARAATSTIPVVIAFTGNAVVEELAVSLARPGGNFTGNTTIQSIAFEKNVEILHEIVPKAARVGLLTNPQRKTHEASKKLFEAAAASRRLKAVILHAAGTQEIPKAFEQAVAQRVDMLVVSSNDTFSNEPKMVVDLAARHRLPTIYSGDSFVAHGGLVFYGFSGAWLFGNAAVFVDRILKGRKPAELPFEQPTTFEMVINMKTAKALGLKIPQSVLVRADRVIE